MEQNKFIKITDDEYFAAEGIHYSTLKELLISPKHYKYKLENPEPSSASQVIGRAIHAAALDPEEFARSFYLYEGKLDRRTKEGKEVIAAAGEREIVGLEVSEAAVAIQMAVPELSKCLKENAIFFNLMDLSFKAKIDAYDEGSGIIYDLKTTADIKPQAFIRSIFNYGYYLQAALYWKAVAMTGNDVKAYRIIAAEKEAPYDVAVYELDQEYLAYGGRELDRLLDVLKTAQTFDHWGGVSDGKIIPVECPMWCRENDTIYVNF